MVTHTKKQHDFNEVEKLVNTLKLSLDIDERKVTNNVKEVKRNSYHTDSANSWSTQK